MGTRLTVGAFTPSVVLAVARRTGRLAAHGLEVTEHAVPSSPAQFRALLAGDLDVAITSPDNVLAYRFDPANPLGATADVRVLAAVDRGLGLALYGRPGMAAADLRGATLGVDVPASGFALAMYALAESLGAGRDDYALATLGSTPRRLAALLAGECDATMLGAGNELAAERAGCVRLAAVAEVCSPYIGAVLSVVSTGSPAAHLLAAALRETAGEIVAGHADDVATSAAASLLSLPDDLAARHVERLKSPTEGLVVEPDFGALATIVALRRRFLPSAALDGALEPAAGLVAAGVV